MADNTLLGEDEKAPTKAVDLIKFWQERIKIARKHKEDAFEVLGVPRFQDEYMGEYDVQLGGIDVPPINEVYAFVESTIANLAFKNPFIAINPKKNASIRGAKILEKVINYFWKELKIKDENELELRDVLLSGEAWNKVGHNVQAVGTDEELKIKSETLFARRVSYRDIVWNIGSRRPPRDCQWMAQRIVRPTSQVKEQYGAAAAGLKGGLHPDFKRFDSFAGRSTDTLESLMFKDDLNYSILWEVWNAAKKEKFLIAEDHDKFLTKPAAWPDYLDEFPFNRMVFSNIPDKPWGMPDIKPWEAQILEKIKLVAMLLNHVKRWNRQLLVREGAIEETEQDKMTSGIDGGFIKVKTQGPLSEAAQPLAYAPFQPEVFGLLTILDNIAKNIHGQPSIDRGAPERTGTRTLGELQFIRQGARSRTDKKVDKFEEHQANIARQLIAHMQANFDLPQVIKITGEDEKSVIEAFGENFDRETNSLVFDKEDIKGEYDVSIKPGSTLALDKTSRNSILTSILDVAVRLSAGGGQLPPFVQTIIRELLDGLGIKSLEQAFEQQNQLIAQQNAQAQQEENVETEKTRAEGDKRRAQADSIRSKTAIEGAETLLNAGKEGVLPEAIALGRGFGQLPSGDE